MRINVDICCTSRENLDFLVFSDIYDSQAMIINALVINDISLICIIGACLDFFGLLCSTENNVLECACDALRTRLFR